MGSPALRGGQTCCCLLSPASAEQGPQVAQPAGRRALPRKGGEGPFVRHRSYAAGQGLRVPRVQPALTRSVLRPCMSRPRASLPWPWPQVTDFNLSRILEDSAPRQSSASVLNPRWLAPEARAADGQGWAWHCRLALHRHLRARAVADPAAAAAVTPQVMRGGHATKAAGAPRAQPLLALAARTPCGRTRRHRRFQLPALPPALQTSSRSGGVLACCRRIRARGRVPLMHAAVHPRWLAADRKLPPLPSRRLPQRGAVGASDV